MRKILSIIILVNSLFCNEFDFFEQEFNKKEKIDKFYSYNVFMTKLNYAFYNMSLRPITNIYNASTPPLIKKAFANFFDNINAPARFLTLLLSAKFKEANATFWTFLGNSTLGFAGIFKPYKYKKESDFGLMFARWGIPAGEHIVLPFIGPSNIRDMFAYGLDFLSTSRFYLNENTRISLFSLEVINKTSKDYKLINEAYKSVNPYIVIKDFYEAKRKALE